MAWLEITIDTAAEKINSVVTILTAKGFSDLVIEDQEEFEQMVRLKNELEAMGRKFSLKL